MPHKAAFNRAPFGRNRRNPPAGLVAHEPFGKDCKHVGCQGAVCRVLDVFADGSLRLIETPGHTRGHISAWLRVKEKSLLLTFDAAHLQANMDLQVSYGAVASRADAAGSLAALQSLARTQPDLEVIYGHEPEQWRCGRTDVKLGATSCAR
jgi:glyoxylase-like metal-dependent hydrolase (beta-lactamase superfamily II)